MKRLPPILVAICWLGFTLALPQIIHAADLAAGSAKGTLSGRVQNGGSIEGRVFNPATSEYLENARVTVEGTTSETFTDSGGKYRLTNVPPGAVQVKAFYTGLLAQTNSVNVIAGQSAQHDIRFAAEGDPIKLAAFVIGSSREMSGAAIAINEQRFAPNLKTVVATDEFGDVAEGNVAELVKFLPGITIGYAGGQARDVSINGVPSAYVPVTIDGFNIASAIGGGGGGTGRGVALDMMSLNNLSRIEVSFSPTPESQGMALAGSVNMVPRSSFERSRPVFNGSVYLKMRDNRRDFHKSPGPLKPTRKVHPGFDFSYIAPVNKRLGFTLSGGTSMLYGDQPQSQNTWRGAGTATNGNAFPHTTPDKPYLSSYLVSNSGYDTNRYALGATIDYKLTHDDRITFTFQYSTFDVWINHNRLTFNVARVLPGDFTTTSTHGAVGAGDIELATTGNIRTNWTSMPTLVWRHDGPIWKAEAGAGLSRSRNRNRGLADGLFSTTAARRTGVTVSFDDIFYLRPGRITVTNGATGAPVDPYSLDSYALTAATGAPVGTDDTQRSAYASLRRDLDWRVPFTLKSGLDVRENVRDNLGATHAFTYFGRDGRASTTPVGSDDQAAPFLDPSFSSRVPHYGIPPFQGVWSEKLYQHYQANPSTFTLDANNLYRSEVTMSKHSEEVISSAYLRGDLSLIDRRLKLVGGVRAELTNVNAEGPLTDPSRNVQRDARGVPILGANGRPLPITSDALQISRLTYLERAATAEKEYLRLFPSLNASFNLAENLIARAAFYTSVGRPNFNQYSGGITLPDPDSPATPTNRIVVNNAGIKAWSAQTLNVRLEYYFEGVGQVSFGAFRREFENFFGATVFGATPEFLALYGLDPVLFGGYDVATQHNIESTVRAEGLDFNYKQALTFLPSWARGVQVFANASAQRMVGDASANFAGYIPRSGSWGVSLTRERYALRANWNYRGSQRRGAVAAGASIEPGTYNWGSKQLYLDLSGEFYFWKRFAVFANMRNAGDAAEDTKIYGPSTPSVARFRQRIEYGAVWTLGLKGSF